MKITKISLLLFLVAVVSFLSCDNAPRGERPPASASAKAGVIAVELAPFDRFPVDDKFPLVFRFAEALAPADRTAAENFAELAITPSKYGTWRWTSDSELHFEPQEPWRPSDRLQVSLKGLRTSDGSLGKGPSFSPEMFQVQLPAPVVGLAKCGFEIKNRAPLIQFPVAELRFNYRADLQNYAAFAGMTFTQGGKSEGLTLKAPSWNRYSMDIRFEGSELFRPDSAAQIDFSLKKGLPFAAGGALEKGIDCAMSADPVSWDRIAEEMKDPPVQLPLVELRVDPPTRQISESSESADPRAPLSLQFKEAWEWKFVPHGKALGLTLDQGVALVPALAGTWKTDEYDETKIRFTPKEEWPVGQRVKVVIDPNSFLTVRFKTAEMEFETPRLESRFSGTEFYSEPALATTESNPTGRRVVSTLEFSHVPKAGEIERLLKIRVRMEPEKDFHGASARTLPFTVKFDDKHPWRAYVQSDPLALGDEPGAVRLELAPGVNSAVGGAPSASWSYSDLAVPSKRQVFQVLSSSNAIVKAPKEKLDRVLTLEFSELVGLDALQSALELVLLPDCKLKENRKLCRERDQLGDEALITPEVLAKAEHLALSPIPRDEATLPKMFHFAFESPGKRELFLRIKKGLQSETKFPLAEDYRSVLFAEQYPRELAIMHQGALLSLSGSRKLGVSLRGIPKVDYELARVLARDVPHLVSVTSGNFSNPSFNSYEIGLDQLAERFHYVETFPEHDPGKTYYSTVDFGRFMSRDAAPKGLFVLSVREKIDPKDQAAQQSSEEGDSGSEGECSEGDECGEGDGESYQDEISQGPLSDRRLVLLTDLGLLVKDTLAGDHDVFVMSFRSGLPVAGATVKLLGQNGVPVFTKVTGADGRVQFPSTKDFEKEKVPLAYAVEKADDFSFLPFDRPDRQLNFSRFETGGVFNSEEAEGLRALVFSDRGIYRPGEESRFGIIVRRRNLEPVTEKLPLELSLTDPRGVEILKKKFALSHLGFDDFRWSSENALTGTYSLGIYLVRKNERDKRALLGSTSFRVDEFQPDKLAVKSRFVDEAGTSKNGWASRKGAFEVSVQNLFGTAAVANTVKGTLLVRPWDGSFAAFPDFNFYTHDTKNNLPENAEDLGELKTDTAGAVRFVPDLERFAEHAFRLEFAAEAFEKDSGRSVVNTAKALVSNAQHFVGWKADGRLDFINKGSGRKLSIVAVGPDLKAIKLANLELRLEETKYISALVKQPNGTLSYQLTPRVSQLSKEAFGVEESGAEVSLKTDLPGDYKLRVFDAAGFELAGVHYVVHGEGNTSFLADRAAEVGIQLSKTAVESDEELEVSINTPYTGSGLLTIEREKVYAAKWFKMDTLSSVQKIKVPRGIVGNAYVSVAFVRALDSKDIFAAPLSYGVKPFSIARSAYTTDVKLSVPEKVQPGHDLEVSYQLSKPGQFLLYAIDEGILQFARYKNPEPVSSFVPKRALEVNTYQILDLLLPDRKIVEELSSIGGDEDVGLGKFKNPFARKRRAPMAFWSGILPDASSGKVSIPIPEYFNGTVRLVAVQVGERTLGVATAQAIAQHDFVIEPQLPYFVSPGDEFEVGATVANTVVGSGKDVKLKLQLMPSAGLEAVELSDVELVVPEGEDRSFRMKLRAKELLGEQQVRIEAVGPEVSGVRRSGSASETISVRPPQAYRTEIQTGVYRPEKEGSTAEKQFTLARTLYPEQRAVVGSISGSPLTVGRGLITYLKDYPYGCTEQLVSAAFPSVMFGADAELGLDPKDVARFTKRAFQALSSRQRADGSFGLWDVHSAPDPLFSVYAVHFLLEAREHSFDIPEQVFERAMTWLRTMGEAPSYDTSTQLAQAYALYVRARSGERVTKEAEALVADLDRQWKGAWRESAISLFLAGSFKLLQLDGEASALLKRPPQIWKSTLGWPLSDAGLYGSVYAWISVKHFPKESWLSPLDTALGVSRMIEDKSFTSFNSSFALMGLEAFGQAISEGQRKYLKILATNDTVNPQTLDLFGERILHADVPLGMTQLGYRGKPDQMFFFELSESGFDQVQAAPYSAGLTIDRELRNEKGEKKSELALDEKLEVTLFVKAEQPLQRVAILELLPGGFEIDLSDEGLAARRSLHEGANTWHPAFIEIQEDRVIFFGDLTNDTSTFTYRLKPLSRGRYTFAAPYAEGMYDPTKRFLGSASTVDVK